jgi:hypothetical protein
MKLFKNLLVCEECGHDQFHFDEEGGVVCNKCVFMEDNQEFINRGNVVPPELAQIPF